MPLVRPALRGVLALRARVLRRRFGSPLEVVALLVACVVAWRAGAHVGARGAAWLDPLLGGVLLLGAAAARSLLYAARELALLLPAGLTPRELAAVRGAELAVALGAGALPALALAAGAAGAASPWLVVAAPALAAGLAGAALALGAVAGRLGPLTRAAALALAVAGLVMWVLRATPSPAAAALIDLARGDPRPLAPLLGLAALALTLGLLLAGAGHEAGLTRAALRDPRRRAPVWRVAAGAAAALLGRAAGALAARDLVLLGRGALPRGLVVLAALPLLAAAVVVAARGDRTLSPWSVELVALLVVGVLAAAAGFLFGVDLPRARRVQLVLERTSALPGALVLRARATGAVLGALPALVAAAAAVAVDPDPARAGLAGAVLLKGLVLVVCVAHDAAGYGLRGECAGDPALATGYPLRVAPLVGVLAFGLLFHVLLGALYLLFGWHGEAARSARRWELDEVQPERAQAA